ncbi:hypothetical protein P12x_002763 [Tundrisphaera lichenicola]|uniref:hypothetical protein n=1 Tax=Tundrisphaera lichenicola TaxID=2029860 RepID=UPI003EBE5CF7
MNPPQSATPRSVSPLARVRVWHLGLLVAFVALAIADIQDHRRTEPFLLGLAGVGFAGYWALGWLGWHYSRRFEARLGPMVLLVLYLASMAGLFLGATVIYLLIEHRYLYGGS